MLRLAIALVCSTLLFCDATAAQVTQSDRTLAESAITFAGQAASKVARLKAVPSAGFVYLPNRITRSGEAYIQWKISAEKNRSGISKLQRALRANRVTRLELASRNIPIQDIVGVKISSRGDLRFYLLRR
jgi:hypothetical protein